MAKVSIIAGCLECCGSTPCWCGSGALMHAHNHREATGHNVWTKEVQQAVARKTELSEEKQVKALAPPTPQTTPAPPPVNRRLSRRAMCLGKIGHRSVPAAQLAIDNCPFDKEFLNVYRCL